MKWSLKIILILLFLAPFCANARKNEKKDSLKPLRICWQASKVGASATVLYFWGRILDEFVRGRGWCATLGGMKANLLEPWTSPDAFISFGLVTFYTLLSGLHELKQELLPHQSKRSSFERT